MKTQRNVRRCHVMRSSVLGLVAACATSLLASVAQAMPVALETLVQTSATLTVDGITFSDFNVSDFNTLPSADILVETVGAGSNMPGLAFSSASGLFSVSDADILSAEISFFVDVLGPAILAGSLALDPAGLSGVDPAVEVFSQVFGDTDDIALAAFDSFTFFGGGAAAQQLVDQAAFLNPEISLDIQTDFTLSGQFTGDAATSSGFEQRFLRMAAVSVPTPAVIWLFAVSMFSLLLLPRR